MGFQLLGVRRLVGALVGRKATWCETVDLDLELYLSDSAPPNRRDQSADKAAHSKELSKIVKQMSFICVLLIVTFSGISSPSLGNGVQRGQRNAALKLPLKNPHIVVMKGARRMELYSDGIIVRVYKIGLGLNPVDDKKRQGDRATPEGEFYVFTRNPKSAFYLSLGVSYPNVEDAQRGLRDGLITRSQHDAIVRAIKRKATPPQNTRLGGDIYIHGNGAGSDWTWGCVALENEDMRELFDAIPVGTTVTIKP